MAVLLLLDLVGEAFFAPFLHAFYTAAVLSDKILYLRDHSLDRVRGQVGANDKYAFVIPHSYSPLFDCNRLKLFSAASKPSRNHVSQTDAARSKIFSSSFF